MVPVARAAWDWDDLDGESLEEPGGAWFAFEFGPMDSVYGVTGGDSTWIVDTPIMGDFYATTFYNNEEKAIYVGAGLSLRLMPRWKVAPFVGGGGSFNLSAFKTEDEERINRDGKKVNTGENYWAGHAESGVRFEVDSGFYELMVRYTWSGSDLDDSDYWLFRVSRGFVLW
jgi:hypothetical protein